MKDDVRIVPIYTASGVPRCSSKCPSYKPGLRKGRSGSCTVNGNQAKGVCEPAVTQLSHRVIELTTALRELHTKLGELVKP